MRRLIDYFRRPRRKPLVRPWALSAPVVVLMIALPLLRPLRHPDPRLVSDEELSRLATVQAIVEHRTLAIEKTDFRHTREKVRRGNHLYSDQPPMMAVLLSGSYWTMRQWCGLSFKSDPQTVAYLLTLLGSTLPVALAAGLIYRMGRLFELHRTIRAGLALAVVLGSGLISYATVLNSHAPAATLVLVSVACVLHVTQTRHRLPAAAWLLAAGTSASLAACVDPAALPFLLLLPLAIAGVRWRVPWRVGGVALYLLGAIGPLLVHAALAVPAGGNWQPWLERPAADMPVAGSPDDEAPGFALPSSAPQAPNPDFFAADDEARPFWQSFAAGLARLWGAFVGRHGLLSHFPVLLVGGMGVWMIMHRHWPATTKALAFITIAGAAAVVFQYAMRLVNWRDAMFASRWFIVFLPLALFWSGAWLRRRHRPATWAAAGLLLAFSVTVSLIGAAAGPMPRDGFAKGDGSPVYTVVGAARNIANPPEPAPDLPVLAKR